MISRCPGRIFLLPVMLLLALVFVLPAHSQTEPRVQVPAEEKSQSHQIVQQLLKAKRIMPSSQVKRGMKGVARSVFQGIKIEEFPVEVVGVLEKVQGGSDLILVKVLGGPVVKRESGIIAGMSGSPVYINGRMIGAIAIGWMFPKEPIGGVTPIIDMIETSLPDKTRRRIQEPSKTVPASVSDVNSDVKRDIEYRPKAPLRIAGRNIEKILVSRDSRRAALTGSTNAATMNMRPATQLLQISGITQGSLPRLRSLLEPYGLEPVVGLPRMGQVPSQAMSAASNKNSGPQPQFVPGGAIGVQLVSGDLDWTAVGTVTFRWDDRILAFGHPMLGKGVVSMPMTTAYIHDIFPSYAQSFKLGSPVRVVGALQQDNNFAVGGTVGMTPDMVPMRVALRDPSRQINKTYNVQMIKDPMLTPMLMQSVAFDMLQTRFGLDSDKMVRVGFKMHLKDAPPITRRNYIYSKDMVMMDALNDMFEAMMLTQMNEFKRGAIEKVELDIALEDRRKTARITRLTTDHNIIKAGDKLRVSVEMEPTNEPGRKFYRNFDFTVPKDTPAGVMTIVAGTAADYWQLQSRVGAPPPRPDTFRELLEAYGKVGALNTLLVQASSPRRFLMIDDQRVYDPPPSWARLVPPARASDIGSFNEVQSRRANMEYSLAGMEFLMVQVESAKHSDKTKPDTAPGATSSDGTTSPEGVTSGMTSTSVPTSFEFAADPWSIKRMTATELWLRSLQPDGERKSASLPLDLRADAPRGFSAREYSQAREDWRRLQRPRLPQAAPPIVVNPAEAQPVPPAVEGAVPTPVPTPGATPTPAPTPTPTPEPDNPNLARPALTWRQSTAADFERGTFEGTRAESSSPTEPATLRPALVSKLLGTTGESFAWSIAVDGAGNTYLGTGHRARIIRIGQDGTQKVIYDGREVAVTALATDASGLLYAGLSPGGRVLRIDPQGGRATTLLNTGQSFIWALEMDAAGNLLAATGGEHGALYRIVNAATSTEVLPNARTTVQPFARVTQRHLRSLAVRGDDIFAGTADEAVLYRIDAKTGAATALFQSTEETQATGSTMMSSGMEGYMGTSPMMIYSPGMGGMGGSAMSLLASAQNRAMGGMGMGPQQMPGNEVLSLAAGPEGVYFGTSKSGTVYRWNAEKGVSTVYSVPNQASVYALRRAPDGRLYAAIGDKGAVYSIRPAEAAGQSEAAMLLEPIQKQSLALALAPSGDVVVGTGNNAAAYRLSRQGSPNLFISNVFDAGNVVRWGALRFTGNATVETRSGNTVEPDALWSDWQPATRNDLSEMRITSPAGRYLQYRVRLSDGDEASLSRLEVMFRPRNQTPTVQFTDLNGQYLRGKETLNWKGTDPDQDTLRYRLFLRREGETEWKPVEMKTRTAATFELDTQKYSDGVYRARLEASDAARNPADPQRAEVLSLPFTIDNSAPRLESQGVQTNGDGTWTLRATIADDLSRIAGAEWRVFTPEDEKKAGEGKESEGKEAAEGGAAAAKTPAATGKDDKAKDDKATANAPTPVEGAITMSTGEEGASATEEATPASSEAEKWQAAAADDDIFDSRREQIVATIENGIGADEIKAGTPIELRARDAAGNPVKITITLP